jgi:adenosylcobinamide-phosphate synthase
LYLASPWLAWVFGLAVLYVTMGFRQFSPSFSGIAEALAAGDIDRARTLLRAWTRQSTFELDENEVSRVAIEQGLVGAYRHVFGPIFWFAVLGPMGAIAYRAATILKLKWGARDAAQDASFGHFAAQAADVVDWLPVRATAITFAIVGNFEDAVHCWRQQAQRWLDHEYGIVLAAGAGALGVKLGLPIQQDHTVQFRPELGVGDLATPAALASSVALVWRSLLFWLALILLITVAAWF